ncbi:MAG: aminotransferase class I/II-fold pyridoxal phosphate-dependent enzyme, partial [Candidatus Omnitrophica bacterium]|nr:aminotransferase class I/II-fold pyridoxal phosphate-dependent enzyme [Candidatus Omnitrophota bacterium]
MNASAASSFFQNRIDSQKERHLYRQLKNITGRSGSLIEFDGRQIVNFSSNDYLGLSLDPSLAEAAADAARRWGTGSGASRLVSGSCEIHNRLEQQIAELKEEEAALLYPSGFQANLGLLSAVAEKGDTIFADRLSHASLIDAARLSEASLKVYPHADFETLERRLKRCTSGKKIVVTDSYFSMDGDIVNLAELAGLCAKQGAYLIVDEAHSNGVFGPRGAGLSVLHRVQGQ